MHFDNNNQAIYLQIVDFVCEKILLKEWLPEDKIPSVRELGMRLTVNPNTVVRAYDFLKQLNIIYDKRGIGYFVADKGRAQSIAYRKQEFTEKELPHIFRTMYLLGIELTTLNTAFEQFKKQFEKLN